MTHRNYNNDKSDIFDIILYVLDTCVTESDMYSTGIKILNCELFDICNKFFKFTITHNHNNDRGDTLFFICHYFVHWKYV